MSRPQNWSIMIYDMVKMVDKGTGSVHEDNHFADSPIHFTICQRLKGGALVAGLMILVMMR